MIVHWGPGIKGHAPHHVMIWPGVVTQLFSSLLVLTPYTFAGTPTGIGAFRYAGIGAFRYGGSGG